MAAPGGLGALAGESVGEAVAFALGFAAGRALEPLGTELAQTAWRLDPSKAIDPDTAAEVAAEDVDAYDRMQGEAAAGGIDAQRFADLYGVVLNAPGTGELLAMLRRASITDADFTHGLRKAKLEPRWDVPLADLQHVRLTPEQLALGIVRSTVRDPGLLAASLDIGGGRVPAYPVWDGDVLAEAKAGGVDADRLRVMVGAIGLPMSAQQAASAYFRGIITLGDYNRAILEGDTRPEWAPFILEQTRQILTNQEYVEGELRGIISAAERRAKTAQHGTSESDSDLLFAITGRPLAVHAITTGLARGGTFGGGYDDVPEPYRDAIRRSAIRPEYAKLDYANRYSYPSAFVIRSLATSGELDEPTTKQTLLDIGWPPELVNKVVAAWFGATSTGGDKHVGKAETQVWTALHRAYVNDNATDQQASADLATIGVAADAIPQVLALWGVERGIVRRSLSPTEIRKAIGQPGKDAAWAAARLHELGYNADDAATFLAE